MLDRVVERGLDPIAFLDVLEVDLASSLACGQVSTVVAGHADEMTVLITDHVLVKSIDELKLFVGRPKGSVGRDGLAEVAHVELTDE